MQNRGKIFSWTLYDFANTAFSVIIVTVIYPTYFSKVVAGKSTWLWGAAVSLSMVLAAIISPVLGAVADISRNRKRFLLFFTLLSVISTGLLFFVKEGMIITGFMLFVLANLGFEAGLVFYDAFLPDLTVSKNFGRVSGYGFAMGYLGALAILTIVLQVLPEETNPDYNFYIRLTFLIASLFYFIFSLPVFLFVSEKKKENKLRKDLLKNGFNKSFSTFKEIFFKGTYPSLRRFLLAFFLYNDAIITVIAFASIFAVSVLNLSVVDTIIFFVIVQSTAIAGSFIFGIVSDHIGPKKTITITLLIWIVLSIGSYFITTLFHFYIIGLLAGIAIGSSQSASRALMARLVAKDREAEFFGFYDGLFGKSSAIIGPVFYGIIADLTGQRVAALAISLFFIGGLILLQKVEEN